MPARAAIYLDSNAGSPLSAAALDAILHLLRPNSVGDSRADAGLDDSSNPSARGLPPSVRLGNPSSPHAEGRGAKSVLNRARRQVASSLGPGVRAEEVTFTSSGTEACQMAIRAVLEPEVLRAAISRKWPHWILGAGDHEAHHQMIAWLEARGGSVSLLPMDQSGGPDVAALDALLRPETALVSQSWVNNETGVVTDVAAIAHVCAKHGVPLHLDGAQAWGKLPLDLGACGARFVSFSGHKIGALSGTGVLWYRAAGATSGEPIYPVFPGKQEEGRRGGTENLLGAASLGAAAETLRPERYASTVGPLRDRLEAALRAAIPGLRIHGEGASRVANTSNLGFEGVEKDGLVAVLDLAGYCVSPGSACSSGITEPSRVLRAMGLSPGQARSAVRVSLDERTSWDELEGFVATLARAVEKARKA